MFAFPRCADSARGRVGIPTCSQFSCKDNYDFCARANISRLEHRGHPQIERLYGVLYLMKREAEFAPNDWAIGHGEIVVPEGEISRPTRIVF